MSDMISSVHTHKQNKWIIIAVIGGGRLCLSLLLVLSLSQGEAEMDLAAVFRTLLSTEQNVDHAVLFGSRLPRAVMALLAGAALAVSGALLQTVTRNPLASAGTFGINAGAYFIVVLGAVFFPALKSEAPLLLALIGGAAGALLAYALAGGRRGTPIRMALAGMIVTMVLASFTSALQLLFENETNGLFLWGSGSLVQNDWKGVQFSWPWIAVCLFWMFLAARKLDLLEFSEETALSLGQKVSAARRSAMGLAILLAAVSVSIVGPIGFVGLVAPHLVKLLGLRRHRVMLPASAIWGAVVLIAADTLARYFRSMIGELPTGTVTAFIGAPWLIWLAVQGAKQKHSGESTSSMSAGRMRWKIGYLKLIVMLIAALAIEFIIGLTIGGIAVPFREMLAVFTLHGEQLYANIIQSRVPRMLVGLLAGAGLAVSGVMMQGAVRNPLADPSVIGVTSGAGAGALLLKVLWPEAPVSMLPLAAIIGAVTAAALVFMLSWRKSLNPATVTLVGIAVSAIGSALIHFMVIQSQMNAASSLAWLAGSTYARDWEEVRLLLCGLIVLLPFSWYMGRKADLLAFGDLTSLGLGLKLRQTRLIAGASGVALAAIAVAAVGTVGFIGLLAPHAARMLVGQNQRKSVVLAALIGAILLLAADIVGRSVIAPKEVPAGLVVALIGTPYLFMLMYRNVSRKA